MQARRGFSLIEILVVILIIGICLGFAMLAFGDFGAKQRLKAAAAQFVNYVELLQQKAILQSNTFAIEIRDGQYQAMQFSASNKLVPISNKGVFHAVHFPANTLVFLSNTANNSIILINGSGDMSPFKLTLSNLQKTPLFYIQGEHNGSMLIEQANAS